MADIGSETLNKEETAELLNDKESKNTQKACKDRNFIYIQVLLVAIRISSEKYCMLSTLQFVTEVIDKVNFVLFKTLEIF